MVSSNNSIFVPEENIVINFEVTDDKPFNKCFQCPSLRNGCSGPNLSVMGVARACEFLQMARIFFHYSYQDVADGTSLSLSTVKRTLTGKISDPSFFTISAISTFLLGDPNGKYPCAIPNVISDPENAAKLNDALRELERVLDDNEDYREALDNIHNSYKAEMDTIRIESQRRDEEKQRMIDHLLEENKRLHSDSEAWRLENERKGRLIDSYISKLIIGNGE